MSHESAESETRSSMDTGVAGRRLGAAGWGLFFVWAGVSTLAQLGWGVGLLGVAAIIFGVQGVRRFVGRRLEPFWLVVGGALLLGGIWNLYQLEVSPVPFVLILVGGAMLLSLVAGRRDGPRWCRPWIQNDREQSSGRRPGPGSRAFGCCGRRV